MTRSDIQNVLTAVYPLELVDSMLTSYENALAEYKKEHWQYFGNEIGQFVEVARRMVEYQLDNRYTPLAKKLKNFNEEIFNSRQYTVGSRKLKGFKKLYYGKK